MADDPPLQFSIDTSCLIESWNHIYQIDLFPSIWDHLEACLRLKTGIVTIQVYEEIKKQDDELHDWCKERKDLFTEVSEVQLKNLQGIMARHPRIAAKGLRNFADPWVVALAQSIDPVGIVVTEERGGKKTNPKIPYVCAQEGLISCTFNRFLRHTGWKEGR